MNAFSVQYISGKATAWKDDCYSVAEKLFEALEYVGGDSELIRGTEMNVNFADEIMTFTVNYNVFMISEPEPEDNQMKTLDIENYAR
jgi:hypothetical protein